MASDNATDLLRRMGITAGSRFIASARLRYRERHMTVLIAYVSSIVIGLTIAPLLYHVSARTMADLTLLTIILSVIIVAVSLVRMTLPIQNNCTDAHSK